MRTTIPVLPLAAVLVACGASGDPGGDGAAPEVVTVEALCAARDAADVATAEQVFTDDAHGPLHELIAALQEHDRGVAADLLVAKQAVEAGFQEDLDLAVQRDRLTTLTARTGAALPLLELDPPDCAT